MKEPNKISCREIVEILAKIPPEDLEVIRNKPASSDMAAYQKWRRMCAKHSLTTAAAGITENMPQYQEDYALRRRLEEKDAELKNLQGQVDKLRVLVDSKRVADLRGGVILPVAERAAMAWAIDHVCTNCLDRLSSFISGASVSVGGFCPECQDVLRRAVHDVCVARREAAKQETARRQVAVEKKTGYRP